MRGDNPPRLHGLVYDIADGVLKDLNVDGNIVMTDMEHMYATEVAEPKAAPAPPREVPGNGTAEKALEPVLASARKK